MEQNRVEGYSQADVRMIQSIANQIVFTIQHAESFANVRQHVKHEPVVYWIGQRIQRATTIEEVLPVAAGESGQASNTQSSRVELRSQRAADTIRIRSQEW